MAIESDRQFGLSVLERVDAELRRRGDLFRKLGVQDLPGYKRAGGTEAVPRSLLMIDEFQEFFTEEDRISQGAAVPVGPHCASGACLWYPCHSRLSDFGRRLHPGPSHPRTNGDPHSAPV